MSAFKPLEYDLVPFRLRPETHISPSLDCPISTLPVELHCTIFLIGQDIERSEHEMFDEEGIERLASPFEVRMSHVSVLWRDMALNTGQLWIDIIVQPGYSPKRVETYLARSKQCLIDIQLRNCPDTLVTNNILSVLFQNSIRWRTCLIEGGLDSWTMSQIVPLCAPNLEWLQFIVLPPGRARRFDEKWQGRPVLTGGCPQLKGANLCGFAVHFSRPPLSNVTHLQLDYKCRLPLNYDEFRDLLTNSPSLMDLSFDGEIIDPMPRKKHTYVVLPKLKHLSISSLHGQVYSGILLTVKAPILQSLVLEGAQDSDLDLFLKAPYDLLHLRSLSLCGSIFAPSKLNKVYTSFPSLEEIVMVDLIFNPSEVLRLVSESICDLGLVPLHLIQSMLSTNQKPKTLALMLDSKQRSALKELLQEKLIDEEDIVDLDNSRWSFLKFFDWLQYFVTAETLLLATTRDT